MENTFPPALVEKINGLKVENVTAEFVKLGGVKMAEDGAYRVIIDRISQDIPFYRAFLKNAALTGSIVINNPFWWTADDKFFFSSRRRHTRLQGDWSSDVCSSD